jgi:hypothetical protein
MKKDPIFKPIFGLEWDNLPPILQRRYASTPHSQDEVVVEGVLNVHRSACIRFLSSLFLNLQRHARLLLKLSHLFDPFGSVDGGIHMLIRGERKRSNGLSSSKMEMSHSPCHSDHCIAKKWVRDGLIAGAMPCVGLMTLEEYLDELQSFAVTTYER